MKKENQNNLSFILWVLTTLFWMWGLTQEEISITYYLIGLFCVIMTFNQSLDIKMNMSLEDNPLK